MIPAAVCGLTWQVFVVDNGAGDGTWDRLGPRTDIRLLRGSRELGFGRGNNLAASNASGRWLLFLNPDTEPEPGSVRRLVDRADSDPGVGVLGPRLVLPDGSLDPAARRGFPTPASAAMRLLRGPGSFAGRFTPSYNVQCSEDHEVTVDAVSGACMLVRTEAFTCVNGFDPQFFTYGEDLDLAYRVKQAGWGALFVPSAVVHHLKRRSTRKRPIRARFEFYRAMWLYYRKHGHHDARWLQALVRLSILVLGAAAVVRQAVLRVMDVPVMPKATG